MLKSNIKNCAPLGSGWDLNPPSFSKVRTTSATGGYGSAWRTIPTRWRSVGHPPTGTTLPVCPQRAGASAAFRLGSWGCSKRRSEAGKVTGSLVILHGHKMMVFTWLRWHIEIPRTAAVSQSQQLFQQGAGPCQFRQDHSQIVFAAAGGGQTHGAVRHLHGTILCAMVLGVGDLGGPGKLSKPKYHWETPQQKPGTNS